MGDNLKLTMNIEDMEAFLKSTDVDASQYCVLAAADNSDTIVITTNDGLKLLLINDHNAKEISDWNFNEEYQKNRNSKQYKIIGDSTLINKGY